MGKVIAVASWKGGTGKTTTVAAVSSCLAEMGYKTLCVDFNTDAGSLDLALGMADSVFADIKDAPEIRRWDISACRKHPKIPNLSFLPSAAIDDFDNLDVSDVAPMFDEMRDNFDYSLVDAMAGFNAGFRLAHTNADMSIIVSGSEPAALKDSLKIASAVLDSGAHDFNFLVNFVSSGGFSRLQPDIKEMTEATGAQLIGVIPDDRDISQALLENTPLIFYGKPRAAFHFLDAARRIAGETIPWRKLASRPPVSGRPSPQDPEQKEIFDEALDEELIEYYGEPETWAKSTLLQGDAENQVKIHVVKQGLYVHADTIRQRMWLHDILDDRGIPYRVEFVGYWASRKKFVEAQNIYVEKKHAERARFLIKDYRNTGNIVQEDIDETSSIVSFDDGMPQKSCPSCGKEIDFDYHTCPYCKTQV